MERTAPCDTGELESVLFRLQSDYHVDIAARIAALMESLVIYHPFVDGNRQVAFAATDIFLRINHYLNRLPNHLSLPLIIFPAPAQPYPQSPEFLRINAIRQYDYTARKKLLRGFQIYYREIRRNKGTALYTASDRFA